MKTFKVALSLVQIVLNVAIIVLILKGISLKNEE